MDAVRFFVIPGPAKPKTGIHVDQLRGTLGSGFTRLVAAFALIATSLGSTAPGARLLLR
jgi:hypothetical protein